MAKGSNLPQELVEDILSRLPYRSLSRFKGVCKFWNSLLTSPLFLPPHLSQFIKHHAYNSVILSLSFSSATFKLFSLSGKDSSAFDTLFPAMMFQILSGHCNGILCLSLGFWHNDDGKIILYNPATREFKCLPDSAIRTDSSFVFAVALGYHSRNDDYKVLRMRTMIDYFWNADIVEEYSLSTDSWRPICISNSSDFIFHDDCFALFFRGTYYWWASSRLRWQDSSKMILGLEMGDEAFHKVSVPREVDISKHARRNLAVWKESVSLICCYDYGSKVSRIDIWVMDGFGGALVSWTKMLSITSLLKEPRPLVFWKEKELLLETPVGEIKSCDLDTKEITNFKIEGYEEPLRRSVQAVNYVATLVPIKGGRYLP
ncbi:hypothetical protein K1719_030087 [Acacia pycnantha]|nr:hypothetical protein K1719_030087 [Acacia pycnantha]